MGYDPGAELLRPRCVAAYAYAYAGWGEPVVVIRYDATLRVPLAPCRASGGPALYVLFKHSAADAGAEEGHPYERFPYEEHAGNEPGRENGEAVESIYAGCPRSEAARGDAAVEPFVFLAAYAAYVRVREFFAAYVRDSGPFARLR
jgi:hypothetical protein